MLAHEASEPTKQPSQPELAVSSEQQEPQSPEQEQQAAAQMSEFAIVALTRAVRDTGESQEEEPPQFIALKEYCAAHDVGIVTAMRFLRSVGATVFTFGDDSRRTWHIDATTKVWLDQEFDPRAPHPSSPVPMRRLTYANRRGLSTYQVTKLLGRHPELAVLHSAQKAILPPETVAALDEIIGYDPTTDKATPLRQNLHDVSPLESMVGENEKVRKDIELNRFLEMARMEPLALNHLLARHKITDAIIKTPSKTLMRRTYVTLLRNIVSQIPLSVNTPNMKSVLDIAARHEARPAEIRSALTRIFTTAHPPSRDTIAVLKDEDGITSLHLTDTLADLVEQVLLRARSNVDVKNL